MSKAENTVATVYGRVDKVTLEEVQNSFDTTKLLRAVDELDAMMTAAKDQDGLRDALLHLHSMAHAVINGAGLSVATDRESLPELAADVANDVREIISTLQGWIRLVEPLERLQARS